MKRTLAIILTLVLMMSAVPMGLFTVTASATEVPALTVTADKESYVAGDKVIITVILPSVGAFKTLGLSIEYDDAIFTHVSAEWAEIINIRMYDYDERNKKGVMTFEREEVERDTRNILY